MLGNHQNIPHQRGSLNPRKKEDTVIPRITSSLMEKKRKEQVPFKEIGEENSEKKEEGKFQREEEGKLHLCAQFNTQ